MTCIAWRDRTAVRFVVMCALLATGCGAVRSVDAQEVPGKDVAQAQSAVPAAPAAGIRFSVDVSSRFGAITYAPAQWGELHLRLENGGATDRDVLCSSYFGDQPNLQFGRQVWLPAHSRLNVAHPALVPAGDSKTAVVHSLVIDNARGNEVLLKTDSGQLRHEQQVLLTQTLRNTGVVAGWSETEFVPQEVLDLVVASRVNQGLHNRAIVLADQFLPTEPASLNHLDHLVLAENRLIDDFAALAAVRRWLHAGGRLWIMLDRAEPVLLERLLGDGFAGHVVDRVELTSVRIDTAPSLTAPDGEPGELVAYDAPVAMARMAVSGGKVWNTVNGWPAAVTCSYGEGRVLITTLGPRGWIQPAPSLESINPAERPAPNMRADYALRSPMFDLAAYILGQREPAALPQLALEPIAEEYVSYSVPTWGLIVGMMSGFLALLFAAGIWLWRSERLEHFGWAGSLLAVVWGSLFTGIGLANRAQVPEEIASVQLVQALDGTDDVRTHGTIAVYRPEGSDARIETTRGGVLWPDLSASDGSTSRMVTTDLGTFHWAGLTQPAGLRTYSAATAASIADRTSARATIDSQGVVGRYAGQPASGSDAVLATRQGRIAVKLDADGRFTAAANDVLETDQFVQATFLGDVQDRRRRMLQQLFANRSWQASLVRPQLLVWADGWDHGFQFGDGLLREGETLLTVPVQITRPPAGTEILIPSPLIRYATTRPPDGSLPTGFWDDNRHEWQERSSPSTTWLSFQLDRGLLPLTATKARMVIKVSGPMGRIEIMGVKAGAVVSLQTVADPVDSVIVAIDDPDVLTVSETGDLSLGVSAGVPADADEQSVSAASGASNYWRIEALALQLWAVAAEPSEVK